MTFQEIQEKLKKCELALTSIKDGSYSNTKYTKEEALEKFNTIKESLEKKLNLLQEAERNVLLTTKKGETSVLQEPDDDTLRKLKTDPNIEKMKSTDGTEIKEDDLSDEEQEEITTETSHTEVVAKEVHKALIDALQDTGHEVSQDDISSLNPETFTISIRFKDNTQSDYSFEFVAGEVKLDGNIIVTTNKKGVTPILNKTIAKDNLVKYFKNLSEKKGKDLDGDGDVDSDDYMIAKDKAIKANMKEDESEPVADKKGKYTGVRRLKLSDKDKDTLKKIEDLLAKEKSLNEKMTYKDRKLSHEEVDRLDLIAHKEFGGKDFSQLSDEDKEKVFAKRDKVGVKETKGAPKGHYFTKSGNLVKGRLTKDARERGARLSDPKDKQRSKVPPVTQYNEGEGDDHHYLKVSRRDYKKTMSILDNNVDPTYVKTEVVDDDGAGNVIIYFIFRHEYGFDDMYDDPEGKENPEFYQEPDEDPNAFMNDVVMDLQANDIEVVDHSAEMDEDYDPDQEQKDDEEDHGVAYDDDGRPLGETDEATDINDPVLMRMRVAKKRNADFKKLDAYIKSPEGRAAVRAQASAERKEQKAREIVRKLKIKRAEIEREMENDPDIEPQGGPVADMYGDQLNKIDNAIEKAASVYNKPMDYDTAVGKVSEDDKFAGSDPKAGSTIKGRGFMAPRTFVDPEDLTPAAMAKKLLDTDYVKRRKEEDDYYEDPDYYKEDVDVGHVDDEPGMLKQDAYEIAQYSIQLFKLLKHFESLDVEVDFPNWWQRKVMLARDYISKATHYLDFKTNEPSIDSQAAALQEDEEPSKADMAKEKSLAKKAALLQFIASMQKKGILDKDKKVLDKDAYKKELDAFKKNVKEGRDLNELSGDQTDALYELQNILDDVAQKGEEARDIIRQSFPRMLSKADAYGAFDFGSSANRYDTTLASIIEEIEEYYDEEEDDMDEGKYKSDAQRKAIHAKKAELKEMDGGSLFDYFQKKGYDLTERRPDGYPPKEGVEGYMVSRGEGRSPQAVIFQHNKDTDEFTISRMSGYRIDQKEAIKAGMRQAGRSGAAGMDSYMTDGNYTPVGISAEGLKDIVDHVMSGLDREGQAQSDFYKDRGHTSGTIDEANRGQIIPGDIVKNQHGNYYMRVDGKVGGHDAYVRVINGKAGKRKTGLHDSFKLTLVNKDELNEEATCCGRCGRVHVKGSGCKRPYLKGKSHCRNK